MTKEEVLAAILDCTEQLGYVPSCNELRKHGKISREQLKKHFGTTAMQPEEKSRGQKAGNERLVHGLGGRGALAGKASHGLRV
jgi:hypothetical protein